MAEPKRLNLITGPSGSGKTVFCKGQPDWDHCLLNLDDFARAAGNVDDRAVRARAWQDLLIEADRRMALAQPVICIDTVFSESDFDAVTALAGYAGYEVALWVLAPKSPDTCAQRIAQRRSTGGHGRPELAGELYESALSAASMFTLQCDYTYLMSTSELRNRALAALQGVHALQVFADTLPRWVEEYFPVYPGEPRAVPAADLARLQAQAEEEAQP